MKKFFKKSFAFLIAASMMMSVFAFAAEPERKEVKKELILISNKIF